MPACRPLIRRIIKWGASCACVLVVACWSLSVWRWFQWTSAHVPPLTDISLRDGVLHFVRYGDWQTDGIQPHHVETGLILLKPRWFFRHRGIWQPTWSIGHPELHNATIITLPLWIPLLVIAIPTSLLWYRDLCMLRRARKCLCPHCTYPLTGLAPNSSCPECGKPSGAPKP